MADAEVVAMAIADQRRRGCSCAPDVSVCRAHGPLPVAHVRHDTTCPLLRLVERAAARGSN